jgi:hypothetical protein
MYVCRKSAAGLVSPSGPHNLTRLLSQERVDGSSLAALFRETFEQQTTASPPPPPTAAVAELQAQIDALEEKNNTLQDKYAESSKAAPAMRHWLLRDLCLRTSAACMDACMAVSANVT